MKKQYTFDDFQNLSEPQNVLLRAVHDDTHLRETFFFTGGTLLKARGIVPRISNDVDLFTFSTISSREYLSHLQTLHRTLERVFGANTIQETERGFLHKSSGMIVDAVHDATANIDDFVPYGTLATVGLRDLAAHKASALCSRDEVKDYIDIALLTYNQQWSLRDLEMFAEKKFHLGTIREEHLITELLAKRDMFTVPSEIFLRDPEGNRTLVREQIERLVNTSTV